MQAILERESTAIQISSELNQFVDLKNTIISVMNYAKNISVSVQNLIKVKFVFNTSFRSIFNCTYTSYKERRILLKHLIAEFYVIISSPEVIFQIFSNLIMNLFIHSFEKTQFGKISFQCSLDKDSYTIQYTDNGLGIHPGLINKIFEPFYTTKKSSCTGLGLSIIYNIITYQMHGTIDCISRSKEGVMFIIKFPK